MARAKRGITANILCIFCAGQPEDCNHLFLQCTEAKAIWEMSLGQGSLTKLESLNWEDWLCANLAGNRQMGLDSTWPERFAIRIWWIWRWRKDAVFNGRTTEATQKCHWIHKQEMEINGAFSKRRVMGTGARHLTEACVKWKAPPAAWVTINVDGSCCRTIGKAACGGLLRDQTGS